MVIIKFLAGFFGNSYALIADAIESSADVLSSVLVWVGLKYSSKPPDENHPYGHGRYEVISTFAVIGFLLISATVLPWKVLETFKPLMKLQKLSHFMFWRESSFSKSFHFNMSSEKVRFLIVLL